MVMFGKSLKEKQVEEWRKYYISYKLLKKKVNQYTQQVAVGSEDQKFVLRDFSRLLDTQIEKVVLFILEQQGLLAERLARLGHRRDVLDEQASGSMVVSELQDAYRAIGQDMLRLLSFVELNAIGLRKILKKFDKRLGYQFTDYYVKTRANHPYSQLQQVFKHVGFTAVVGAISHSLAELHDNQSNYVSIYDQPALAHPDPVVGSIQAAVKRLSHSTNFLEYLAKHAFIFQVEEATEPSEEDLLTEKRYDFMSLNLNLINAFLYMVNTYIVVPTADKYSLSLGAAATVSGVVIGSMALAQVFSSVYFSAWSNRSYLRPLVFSSIVLLLGNILYALAYDLDSVTVLLIGRLFCGLGSARAVNRRYISDCVPLKLRMRASAGFVSASALGMACGPALACLFQTRFKFYRVTLNEETLPGWFMALAWLLYLLCLWACFREPPPHQTEDHLKPESIADWRFMSGNSGTSTNILEDNIVLTQRLLVYSESEHQNDEEVEDDDEDSKKNHKPVTSIVAAYRLLTPSVKVQLLVYFMLKYAMEILLAESSLVTGHYFIWSTRNVAIFLACLGLTVLPVNVVVGNYFSNIFEERQLLLAAEIILCIGIALSFHVINPYSVSQYVGAAVITFVSAEVLEGVNLSLLSRVMSSRLSRGTYNGGLLSTEAGTLARVVADGTITLSGYLGGYRMLMNVTLVPSLLICISSIVATCFTYNSLY